MGKIDIQTVIEIHRANMTIDNVASEYPIPEFVICIKIKYLCFVWF